LLGNRKSVNHYGDVPGIIFGNQTAESRVLPKRRVGEHRERSLEEALKKAVETGQPWDLESLFIPSGSKDKIRVQSLGRDVYSGGKIVRLGGTFQNI
jgi:hypothetical protein